MNSRNLTAPLRNATSFTGELDVALSARDSANEREKIELRGERERADDVMEGRTQEVGRMVGRRIGGITSNGSNGRSDWVGRIRIMMMTDRTFVRAFPVRTVTSEERPRGDKLTAAACDIHSEGLSPIVVGCARFAANEP